MYHASISRNTTLYQNPLAGPALYLCFTSARSIILLARPIFLQVCLSLPHVLGTKLLVYVFGFAEDKCLCCLAVPRPDAFGFSRAVVLPIASFPSPDGKRFAWLVAHWQLWPGLFLVLPPFLLLQRWLSWPGLICQANLIQKSWSWKVLGSLSWVHDSFGSAYWSWFWQGEVRASGRHRLFPVCDGGHSVRSALRAPTTLSRNELIVSSWRTSAGLLRRVSRSQAP